MEISTQELTLLISLLSLGFFGGFSHCMGMCGPFVLMQVSSRLGNVKIEQATVLKKLSGMVLIPYHFGRITTYGFIGALSSFLTSNLKEISGFKLLSAFLLFVAALVILGTVLREFKIKLNFSIRKRSALPTFKYLKLLMGRLFDNPSGIKGYFLGILLGFIPCGLLYGAITVAAAVDSYLVAGFGMLIFGVATIPSLLLTSCGGFLFFNKIKEKLKIFTKFILIINAITLFIMSIGIVIN